jgi:hypothetical protein
MDRHEAVCGRLSHDELEKEILAAIERSHERYKAKCLKNLPAAEVALEVGWFKGLEFALDKIRVGKSK